MGHHEKSTEPIQEVPDEWWYKVYAAVFVTTAVVIILLELFTRYFS